MRKEAQPVPGGAAVYLLHCNRRNPSLSEHAFRLLPYRGMGSGIPRALGEWPQIELISEAGGNQFTASVQRPQGQGARGGGWRTSDRAS